MARHVTVPSTRVPAKMHHYSYKNPVAETEDLDRGRSAGRWSEETTSSLVEQVVFCRGAVERVDAKLSPYGENSFGKSPNCSKASLLKIPLRDEIIHERAIFQECFKGSLLGGGSRPDSKNRRV